MHQREIDGFMKALAPVMGAFVREAVGVLLQPMMEANKALADEIVALKAAQETSPKPIGEETVLRLVDERVAKIPPVEPGKDVAALVDKAAAAIDAMGPQIEAAVAHHVSALPKAEPVKGLIADDLRPMLQEMIDAIEKPKGVTVEDMRPVLVEMLDAMPKPEPVKAVTVDDLAPLVADVVDKAVGAIEVPKGPDEALIALLIGEKVEAAVAEAVKSIELPTPEKGDSVTVEQLAPLVADQVGKAVAGLPVPKDGVGLAGAVIDREGELVLTLTDGSTKALGVVVGKDVDQEAVEAAIVRELAKIPHPKDGLDGVGFDDLSLVEVEGDLFLRFTKGEVAKDFHLPVPTDRGVWVEREFKQGAGVTGGGSFWIAQRDTSAKPDTPDSGWRLSVKRGRDGASAFDVARKAGFRGSEREWLDSLRPGPAKPVKVS